MKIILALMAGVLLGAPLLGAQPEDGEAELARALDGRVAGEPVDCINLPNIRSSRIINRTAILYDAGRTIYVNRPRSGVESLRRGDTMVTRPTASRLCSVDTVRMIDSGTRSLTGIVFLGEFVPYRRPR